jgi:hypothetical protein
MIIGMSHLIFSCKEGEAKKFIDILLRVGYEYEFSELGIENNPKKFPFLRDKRNLTHNLYFLSHPTRFAIEIVEYSFIGNVVSNIIPSFERKLSPDDSKIGNYYYNDILKISYIVSDRNKIFLPETDNKFLVDLGFKKFERNEFVFRSFLKKWEVEIETISSKGIKVYMDDHGINAISFWSKNLKEFFKMVVNNRRLKVCLISREYFLELLEVAK